MRALTVVRPVPFLHHHRHGGSHTTGIGMTARAALSRRAIQVIRVVLVPVGGNQRGDIATDATGHSPFETRSGDAFPLGRDFSIGLEVVFNGISALAGIIAKVISQAF